MFNLKNYLYIIRKFLSITLLFFLFFLQFPLLSQDIKNNVIFQKNYQDGMVLAKQSKKAVLLDFYADWCEPCKEMDRDVLTEPTVTRFFNSNFVSIKINGESREGKKLMREYMVTGFPTYIFISK